MLTVILTNGQESSLAMILKAFATLGFICTIDNQFVKILPTEIKDHAASMNKNQQLIMGVDHNTNTKLLRRIRKQNFSWTL